MLDLEQSLSESRLGRIEIQVRSNLDRGRFLALYLVQRANFEVSMIEKILQIFFVVL